MGRQEGPKVREVFALPPGKMPIAFLRHLIQVYVREDPRVIMGPGVGRDAAVIDFGDQFLIAKSDPITFATEDIGWYSVHVNANDVVTTGARPRWFLATILLPEGNSGEVQVETIFQQIQEACGSLDISLCGGHTEVTLGLGRPLVIGMMLGEVGRDALVRQDGAKPGDRVLLTKGLAIEGTAVLAREHTGIKASLHPAELKSCAKFLREPGISVVRDALAACGVARIHAMHDPTEGGVATALHELAEASGVGLRINKERIPIYPETQRVCQELGLDPLGLLASGTLLLVVASEDCGRVIGILEGERIAVANIGEVTPAREGINLIQGKAISPMPLFSQDEVARALASSIPDDA
jgi:hydrogenase expression/formation protein HypE